ncbi:unnamed protein product, partial [Brenthis ino]
MLFFKNVTQRNFVHNNVHIIKAPKIVDHVIGRQIETGQAQQSLIGRPARGCAHVAAGGRAGAAGREDATSRRGPRRPAALPVTSD